MLPTIRAKLIALFWIILAGTLSLGYVLISNTSNAENAVEKVRLTGDIGKVTNELLMQSRGYQLTFKPIFIENYYKAFDQLATYMNTLEPMLHNAENIALLKEMRSRLPELKQESDERFDLMKKYGEKVNTPEFAKTPDGQKFTQMTNHGRETFIALVSNSDKLAKSIQTYEYSLLEKAHIWGIIVAILTLIISNIFRYFIVTFFFPSPNNNLTNNFSLVGSN